MSEFILRRLFQSVGVVLVMSVLVFVGVYAIGNPVDLLISPTADQIERDAAIKALGLDKPLVEQYFVFLGNVVTGDLGNSFATGRPVSEMIADRLPATLELAFLAILIAIVVGIPLGMLAGRRPGTVVGRAIATGSVAGFSLPSFWVGMMMILIFAVYLRWLPPGGRGEIGEFLGIRSSLFTLDGLSHAILPAVNLAIFKTCVMIRLARASVLEIAQTDFIRFAEAKGLTRSRIVNVHILKNILIPIVTVLGMELGSVIAFAVVTETIFAWPGLGKLIIDSIYVLDRPVVVGYLMVMVIMFIVINFIVDVLYSMLDPRVRLQDVD
ncbi:MAG: ABC transporter permease [Devosia sp.]